MSYTRDRLGRLTNVKDAVDQAAGQGFGYNDQLQLETEIMTGLVSKTITRSYWDEGTVLGTPKELQVGTAGNPGADYETGYHYDGYGRLERVTGPGLPGYGAVYEYQPESDLVKKTSFKSDVTTTRGTITRASCARLCMSRSRVPVVKSVRSRG